LPAELGLSDYEVSLLTAISNVCESRGVPYIHDTELTELRGFENHTVIVADILKKLSERGYLEQSS